jgi:hypothetical protein
MTTSDDTLATEMIGLLREIKGQQDTAAQKSSALERAMFALNQGFGELKDRRLDAQAAATKGLSAAVWGLSVAILIAGGLVAAAITWGIR